ncbi:MAG: 50S ribosomal protein L11 methyltransferase [Acidobacteria bacterium]|nr:50S ribosomal protein L11 methyltransferase [Acidobacteriota bacterium]
MPNSLPRTPRIWPTVDLVAARHLEELLSTMCWDFNATGIETVLESDDQIQLRIFFAPDECPADLEDQLREGLRSTGESPNALYSVTIDGTEERDWQEEWKKSYECLVIGSRWLVIPSWKRPEAEANPDFAGRHWIEIDPGMAFGTGTHDTTRMCLEFLEALPTSPTSIGDIGTGTGILAIGATRLFPAASVFACDNDPEAIRVAAENLEINQVADRIELKTGSVADYPPAHFDLILANLIAEVIIDLAEPLAASLKPGGHAIFSGIISLHVDEVQHTLEQAGLQTLEIKTSGEWRAILSRKLTK